MSQIQSTKKLQMGKGCEIVFYTDASKPTDSIHSHWAQTTYDGELESWVPEIGRHWHKHHDEYMEVLEGRISFTLDDKTVLLEAGDPPLHIPRLHVHSFKFVKGVKTMFTEKTSPAGDFKEKFFTELLDTDDGKPNLTSVARSFYDGDTFIALPGGMKWMDETVMWAAGGVVKWLWPKR